MEDNATVIDTDLPIEKEDDVSIEDTLRDTLRGMKDKGAEVEKDVPLDDTEKAANIAKERDETGKLKAKEAPIAEVAPIEGAPVIELVAEVPAPSAWKKEAQAEWNKLPSVVKDEFIKREADFHKGIEQYKSRAQFAESLEKTFAPHMATINSLGTTPETAVKELLGIDHLLRYGSETQKAEQFVKIFNQFKPNLDLINQYIQGGTPQIDPVQQRLNQLEQTIAQQNQQAMQQEDAALNSEIARFAADPKHKHFESVKPQIAALLQAGIAKDLDDAYDQAINANPATRALVFAEQQAIERAEATRKAQEAKQAASVNTQRRPALPQAQPIGSMEDTIRQVYRNMNAA
jgi:hypothetical protein